MPLWIVTAEIEAVICSTTKEEAEQIAHRWRRDIVSEDDDICFQATDMPLYKDKDGVIRPFLPADYDEDSLPHGGDGKRTIGQLLEQDE